MSLSLSWCWYKKCFMMHTCTTKRYIVKELCAWQVLVFHFKFNLFTHFTFPLPCHIYGWGCIFCCGCGLSMLAGLVTFGRGLIFSTGNSTYLKTGTLNQCIKWLCSIHSYKPNVKKKLNEEKLYCKDQISYPN